MLYPLSYRGKIIRKDQPEWTAYTIHALAFSKFA